MGAADLSGASSKAAAAHNSNWVPQSLSSEMKALVVRPPRRCCPPALPLPPPLSFSSSFNYARLPAQPLQPHPCCPPPPHPPAQASTLEASLGQVPWRDVVGSLLTQLWRPT